MLARVMMLLLAGLAAGAYRGPIASIHGGMIIGRKQGQTMEIYAYPSDTHDATDVNIKNNTKFWVTVEVVFAGGEIEHERIDALHDLNVISNGNLVGIADLSGRDTFWPAGLVMTITYTDDTDMDKVHIDYSDTRTHIGHFDKEVATMPAPHLFTILEEDNACNDIACGSNTERHIHTGVGGGLCSNLDKGAMTLCYKASGEIWDSTVYEGKCTNGDNNLVSHMQLPRDEDEDCTESSENSYYCEPIKYTVAICQEECYKRTGCEAFAFNALKGRCDLTGQNMVRGVDSSGSVVGGNGNTKFKCYTKPDTPATTTTVAASTTTVKATTLNASVLICLDTLGWGYMDHDWMGCNYFREAGFCGDDKVNLTHYANSGAEEHCCGCGKPADQPSNRPGFTWSAPLLGKCGAEIDGGFEVISGHQIIAKSIDDCKAFCEETAHCSGIDFASNMCNLRGGAINSTAVKDLPGYKKAVNPLAEVGPVTQASGSGSEICYVLTRSLAPTISTSTSTISNSTSTPTATVIPVTITLLRDESDSSFLLTLSIGMALVVGILVIISGVSIYAFCHARQKNITEEAIEVVACTVTAEIVQDKSSLGEKEETVGADGGIPVVQTT